MAATTVATLSMNCASRTALASSKGRFTAPAFSVRRSKPAMVNNRRVSSVRVSAQVGLFFSTTTGNTEEVADLLKSELDESVTDPADIGDLDGVSSLADFDGLIVGAPTWNTGADEMRSGTAWDDVLEEIAGLDLSGKKVAVFGCGDSGSYTDYFCDAIEEVYSTFKSAGADMVGHFDCEGYEFEESKSCVGGPNNSGDADKLLGLAIDVENQADMTEDRVASWATQLKSEMSL